MKQIKANCSFVIVHICAKRTLLLTGDGGIKAESSRLRKERKPMSLIVLAKKESLCSGLRKTMARSDLCMAFRKHIDKLLFFNHNYQPRQTNLATKVQQNTYRVLTPFPL